MKRSCLLAVLLVSAFNVMAQSADPVIMKIAGHDVTRSEFEYNYNKNNSAEVLDRKDLEQYVDLFVNYKLKVQAALDAQMDTLTSFKEEFKTYRDQQISPLLVSPAAEETAIRDYYDGMLKQLDGHDLRFPAHIFLRVNQSADAVEQAKLKERVDSIHNALLLGADFASLAKQYSNDTRSAVNGGDLGWFGPGQLVPEFEQVMYKLNKGELSEPFQSPVGYHIVLLKDCKNLEPYEELAPQIRHFLESRGLKDQLAKQAIDLKARTKKITAEQVMDGETERLCKKDNELKYLVQEYHDGLLLYEYCKTTVWDPATKDTVAMEKYFKKHKKDYSWDIPHYYGMLFQCRNQADVQHIEKLIKKLPESQWIKAVRGTFNKDSVMVRMEQKLFKQGDNAQVDSLAFKSCTGKTKVNPKYPYVGLQGRLLKKGPKVWSDVGSRVAQDYQNECENKFIEDLRKRYTVEVYRDVLDTVNKHD